MLRLVTIYINTQRDKMSDPIAVLSTCERLLNLVPVGTSDLSAPVQLESRCGWPRRNAVLTFGSDEFAMKSMEIQSIVRGCLKIKRKSNGFVFINTNIIVLGRNTMRVTFDLKDRNIETTHFSPYALKRFNLGTGFADPAAIKSAVEAVRDSLVDDISHQNFSVIMEHIINLRVGTASAAAFSMQGFPEGSPDRFIESASRFIFGSEFTRHIITDYSVCENRSTCESLYWSRTGGVCVCQRPALGAMPDLFCGSLCGILVYRCNIPGEYDAYIPADEFIFRRSHTSIECRLLQILKSSLFKLGTEEKIHQKYIADITDIDPLYKDMKLSGIGSHIKCDPITAHTLISKCVSRCPSVERSANGNQDVFICKNDTGAEYIFEWWLLRGVDFILKKYVVRPTTKVIYPANDPTASRTTTPRKIRD